MDPLIEKLRSTTFFGKRFTRRQLADIQATVGTFPDLSRTELGQTICEHLLCWRGAGERDGRRCLGPSLPSAAGGASHRCGR